MGAYNVLKVNEQCLNCGASIMLDIQFKFGDTWQYNYLLGEKIRWGGADIGIPNLDKVKVYGITAGKNSSRFSKIGRVYALILLMIATTRLLFSEIIRLGLQERRCEYLITFDKYLPYYVILHILLLSILLRIFKEHIFHGILLGLMLLHVLLLFFYIFLILFK